jgi:hypothetical protein
MGERERSIWNKGKINNTVKEHSAIIAKKYKKVRKKRKSGLYSLLSRNRLGPI